MADWKSSLLLDPEFEYLRDICTLHSAGYAMFVKDGKQILLHRFVMEAIEGQQVDHRFHNILDCRKANLRITSQQNNLRNSRRRLGGSSMYKGVKLDKGTGKWRATITIDYITTNLGSYTEEKRAAQIYNDAALKHFGEFAFLNKID